MPQNTKLKKVVVFIVEGKSDKAALEHIFKVIYKHKKMTFEFTRGDLTSDMSLTLEKVQKVIYEKVETYIKENKLNKNLIWQIVQIFDTDGVYIPDTSIIDGETSNLFYTTTNISCKDTQKIVDRNKWKKEIMDQLLKLQNIKGIPYKCFFMSSNLDHALYNMQNLTEEGKEEYSNDFYEKFQNREMRFIDFLKEDVVNGCPDSFPASWKYIKEGLHSLERHTNLHIYFMENPYS